MLPDAAADKPVSLLPLGYVDFSLAGNEADFSDRDGAGGTPSISVGNAPIKGLLQPDAIASFAVGGTTYFVTANEGDSRDTTKANREHSASDAHHHRRDGHHGKRVDGDVRRYRPARLLHSLGVRLGVHGAQHTRRRADAQQRSLVGRGWQARGEAERVHVARMRRELG